MIPDDPRWQTIPTIPDYPRRAQMILFPSCLLPDASSQVRAIVWGFTMGSLLMVIIQSLKVVRLTELKLLNALAIEHHRSIMPNTLKLRFSCLRNFQVLRWSFKIIVVVPSSLSSLSNSLWSQMKRKEIANANINKQREHSP